MTAGEMGYKYRTSVHVLDVFIQPLDTTDGPQAKHTRVAQPGPGKRDRIIRCRKVKLFWLAIFREQPFVLGKRDHIGRIQDIVLVVEINGGGSALVGMSRDVCGDVVCVGVCVCVVLRCVCVRAYVYGWVYVARKQYIYQYNGVETEYSYYTPTRDHCTNIRNTNQ